jgi:hypothetical protein
MKANIKKGKSWEVETPAEYEKNGHKRSNKKISKMSKEFKRYQNKKVRQENFMNDDKGKTEKEMALEELSKRLEEMFESFFQELTENLNDFELPDDVNPEEAVEVANKTMDKCLERFQESLG